MESYLPLILLLIVTLINPAVSMKCFHCRSDIDPDCSDPFDNRTTILTNCDYVNLESKIGIATSCVKITKKVDGAQKFYMRRCGWPAIDGEHNGCKIDEFGDEKCICDKDACNGRM
ncbi:Uncharacterised protein g10724 [Pycnogonum litorale]